ncbi:MAG TPA: TatD family hydrolase [Chthoniobacteraceae bacterium]|nr:TatD family hydrolase [Chthoniobacteraceae bacterium]
MSPLTETHAHLDYPEFQEDFAAVLQRAEEAGVRRMLSIGTSLESSRRAIALAEQDARIFAVAGVHPNSVDEAPADVRGELRALAEHPRVAAIGEAGLDYHRLPAGGEATHKSAQARLFTQQLDVAADMGLNVVIHQRDAWEDTLAILRDYTGRLRAVFHCFGGTFEQASEIIRLGHMISFTGIVTFKNAPVVQDCASRVGAEHFMVETDCPYLAPVPRRGQRCEPSFVRLVAEKIAELRGVPIEEIAARTTENAERFFRFKK